LINKDKMGVTSNKKVGGKLKANKAQKSTTVAVPPRVEDDEEIVESPPAVENQEDLHSVDIPPLTQEPSFDIDWKKVTILSVPCPDKTKKLCDGVPGTEEEWDFNHLNDHTKTLLTENPDSDLFLAGADPFRFGRFGDDNNECPAIVIIKAPSGGKPPPFSAICDENGNVEIVPLANLKASWEEVPGSHGRVYRLFRPPRYSTRNKPDMKVPSYAILHTIKPADLARKVNGMLDIQTATFVYAPPNGGPRLEETYEKGCVSLHYFCDVFCEGHDLDLEDHVAGVKEAITAGFAKTREEQESLIRMYEAADYTADVLSRIEVVSKVFPRNPVITNLDKSGYVNKFYLKARTVV
jgi:hypothetical protein